MLENSLSIGKVRGLAATSTPEGVFTILAFDHRQSFVKMLNPNAPQAVTYTEVVAAKSDVVRALAPHASAVLLDPVYGAAQVIANGALPGPPGCWWLSRRPALQVQTSPVFPVCCGDGVWRRPNARELTQSSSWCTTTPTQVN